MTRIIRLLRDPRFLLLFFLLLNQCSSTRDARREPDLAVHVGALNLSELSGRIEKKDVSDLARVLKREKIEILVVCGLTRYPGVRTRVDLVDELSAVADMRHAVGELNNNSGRQTVNVVFSTYPIRSSDFQPFDGIASSDFDGAVHAFIDGGVRDLHVVGAQFPARASADEQSKCVRMMAARGESGKTPMVVAGNLPVSESTRKTVAFEDTQDLVGKSGSSRIWYSGEELSARSGRTVRTGFGTISVVEFGLFR